QFSDIRCGPARARATAPAEATPSRLRRFSRSAKGYWVGRGSGRAWLLTVSLVAVVFASLGITYGINLWNRHFFDALEAKNAALGRNVHRRAVDGRRLIDGGNRPPPGDDPRISCDRGDRLCAGRERIDAGDCVPLHSTDRTEEPGRGRIPLCADACAGKCREHCPARRSGGRTGPAWTNLRHGGRTLA